MNVTQLVLRNVKKVVALIILAKDTTRQDEYTTQSFFVVAKGLYVISSKFTSEDVKSIFCNAFTG